jgi:hypothetical protein
MAHQKNRARVALRHRAACGTGRRAASGGAGRRRVMPGGIGPTHVGSPVRV